MNPLDNRPIKKVKIIANPNAGNYHMRLPFLEKQMGIEEIPYKHEDVAHVVATIQRKLNKNQIETEAHIPKNIEQSQQKITEALTDGTDVVMIVGGDGSINHAATIVTGTDLTLAVCPYGTANVYAVAFGIPTDLDALCERVVKGERRRIDVGCINKHVFLCMMGVGFDAFVIRCCCKKWKRFIGPFVFIGAFIQALVNCGFKTITCEINDHEYRTIGFIINNVPHYGGNKVLAADAKPDDGYLDVTILEKKGLLWLIRLMIQLMTNKMDQWRDVQQLKTKKIIIKNKQKQHMHVDGEYIGKQNDPITVREKQLWVI